MKVIGCFAGKRCAGSLATALGLLRELGRAGHGVAVVGVEPEDAWWVGADVAIAHLDDPDRLVANSSRFGVPVVILARTPGELRHVEPDRFALAVFSSQAALYEARWRGPSLVARPPIRVAEYAEAMPAGSLITLVNLSAGSGVAILYELARRLPERQFLGVRGCVGQQLEPPPGLPNVEVVGPVEDIRDVYRRTRVLLMPGDQTYGRAAVEAACSRIPTIAHPSAGAYEALGASAIWIRRERLDEWVNALRALEIPDASAERSAAAFARAVQLDPTASSRTFVERIEAVAQAAAKST